MLKFIKKLVLAWDPDYTKVTHAERKALEEAEKDIAENGTISHDAINWDQGAIKITIQQKIDMACAHAGISKAELSRRLGYKKPQSFQTRYDTGKFTQEELQDIAQATGGKYISVFQYPDDTEI